jgi:general secretion pathway protein G
MVELMVVIIIIALLMALLIPAIGAAVKSARSAAVSAEINQLAQALADFKNKYGDYPPSRIILSESGVYDTGNTTVIATAGSTDITLGQLAQRSLTYMRKFFPRADFRTTGTGTPNIPGLPASVTTPFYDFNNNGQNDGAYIIQGHECLVFFLGGIPSLSQDPSTGKTVYGMTGFSKNPQNPFLNDQIQPNRLQPFFEFASNRLDDTDFTTQSAVNGFLQLKPNTADSGFGNQIPGYFEGALKTSTYYAYFSAYAGAGYDPNDVNFFANVATNPQPEQDSLGNGPTALNYKVGGAILTSVSPNPYTTTKTAPVPVTAALSVQYLNPQSFQIISAGADGLYGVGGYYSTTVTPGLPNDLSNTTAGGNATSDPELRLREWDNLTNFHNGKLQ